MRFKIEEYEASTGTKKVRLAGAKVSDLFETVEDTEISGVSLLNGTHLARNTKKVKPLEIKGDNVVHAILVTKNDREIETIVTAEVQDCKLLGDNPKIVEMQAKSVKNTATDLSNKARDNQLTEEEKVKAVKETLKSLQLQGVELSTIKKVIKEW